MIQYNIFTSIGELSISFDDEQDTPTLYIYGPKPIVAKVLGGIGEEDELMAWVTEKDLVTVPKMMYAILEIIKVSSEYSAFTFMENTEEPTVHVPQFAPAHVVTDSLEAMAIDFAKKLEDELQEEGVENFDHFVEQSLSKKKDCYELSFRITEEGVWYPASKVRIYTDSIVADLSERYEGGDMWSFIEEKSDAIKQLQISLFGHD